MNRALKLLFWFVAGPLSLFALPAQVIIVRHAEKDPVTRQLSEQGYERAGALAYYLTETDYLLNFGLPAAIFASRSVPISDRLVPRTIETVMPLAELLQLPIHIPYNGYQVNEIANLILNSKKYNGKSIVVCWNHSSIFDLVHAFGYEVPFNCTGSSCTSPPQHKYPDCRFDLTFVLTYPAPPPPGPGQLPYAMVYFQQLLFGDLTCQSACNPPLLPATPCSFDSPSSPLATQVCDTCCPDVGLGDDD